MGYNATVVWSIADGSPNNSTSTWQLEYSVNGGAWRVNHGGGSPRTISIESLETGKVRFRVKRVSTPVTGYSNVYEIDYTTPKAFLNCSIVDLLDSDPYGDVAPESGTVCVTGGVYTGNVYVEQQYENAIAEGVQLYIDQTHELTATNVRLYGNENMKKRVPNGAKLVRFYNAQADTVWDVDASTGKIKGAASRQCR
ncbi:hypothetical protein UJ101_02488 [Flavobacteriaceae bacterium UJ101]|nr:hypothetical protein UJ101_02488 [Flavobacteriaceae bacterium UJ101]